MDFLIEYAITTILTLLKSAIKNAETKAKYESAMKKVFNSIKNVYPQFDN